ncbi:MAG: protein TolR [Isosphaeraceae bacterium]
MLSDRLQAEELPQINMTPMVDVVLCLLVFFMAATRLYDWEENQFVVNVPQVADAAPLTAAPDDLSLTIIRPGLVALGEKTYELPALATLLGEARGRYADQGVVIRGDARLNYQDLADVLSTCDSAGIRNVRLPVHPRPPGRDTGSASDSPAPATALKGTRDGFSASGR